jgi:phosphate transport system permease protein
MVGHQRAGTRDQMKNILHTAFERTRLQRAMWDHAMVYILSLCALLILFILFAILTHLFIQGISSLNPDFFTQLPKPVGEKGGGMVNAIVGTLTLLGLAVCVGVPIGLGSGVYLSEYAHQNFAQVVRFVADVMNGIPSIVYGIFAYIVCVLPMKSFSALSGGFALGIMMIPMITRTSEQFVRMVPSQLREAGLALGVPKWRVTVDIIIPSALAGITTGIMVALARVAGETAPLLFTAFGNHYWQRSLTQPIAALPLQVFTYAIAPFDDWHRQAWAGAIVLILMVLIINGWAQFYVMSRNRWASGK